ncbi:ABC transporter transmembrane region 2-domain-containing protein [Lanmaoa asiatica]|nr:ABC transporter transmembrane region 2-domain-containing protein [Lanmaoa asiatica]
MFEESAPPSPNQALVALAPLDPEWQPILHASNQVVLYNPTSHALTIHKSPNVHVPDTPNSPCPFCHRPLPPGFGHDVLDEEDMRREGGSQTRVSNYFQLLAIANESSRPSSPPPLGNGDRTSAFPREVMADGYFKAFFQEEYRLGMGANGSVFLCQHVLDGNPLGHFAVKKIAVGESHSYLLGILREIRLLETLHHRNIITYHHAWLETCQFSSFGPKVPTLQPSPCLEVGIDSLDDLIDVRLGRPTRLPHMRSSASACESPTDVQSSSARIRAFRAMKRAPPDERERLRREMNDRSGGAGCRSLKAVHLFSAEEVKSLFSDVVEGLAFLHDRSILHLDLKPGNVLLTWDEGKLMYVSQLFRFIFCNRANALCRPRAMLSDFGTSRDMIHSSGSRSGNTGTLEYASPESLPSPQTGLLQEVDSKSDMWSLGMILHKMLFFRLPYRYATEGEASARDEADKMDRLEEEIVTYPGFRTTSSLVAVFESRHLPRAFLILLESLLSVNPSVRPTSERIVSAMREGKFNPVTSTPGASSGLLVPVKWATDEGRRPSSPRALPPVPVSEPPHREATGEWNEGRRSVPSSENDEKSPLLRLPSLPLPEDDSGGTFERSFADIGIHVTQDTLIRSAKAYILAAKVVSHRFDPIDLIAYSCTQAVSVVSRWDDVRDRPVVLAALAMAAMTDTISEQLQVSLVLGVFHVVTIDFLMKNELSLRQPLFILVASILVFRSAFLPLPAHSHAHDARQSKLSLSSWKQLRSLLRIVIPSIYSREALLLLAHSCFLVLRTVLSVAVAKLDGRIVRDLVSADGHGFLKGLALWFALAVPSIYTNSMARRRSNPTGTYRLTRYIHDLYLSPAPYLRYYRVPLHGVDQYITADVESWSECVAGIYGNLMKPSLDLLLFTSQLSRSLGFRGTFLLFGNYYLTIKILQAVTPAFGRLAAIEARLEGDYRAGVGRVGRESEEVAQVPVSDAYTHRDILTRAYLRLIKHVNSIYKIRIAYEWTEDFVIKYLWSAAGYGLIAVPLLITRKRGEGKDQAANDGVVAARTETYISNRRLLLSLADAGGRLMYAYKDLVEVAGLTGRLYTLLSTLHCLTALPPALPGDGNTFELRDVDVCIPSLALPSPTCNGLPKEKNVSSPSDEDAEPLDHLSGSGTTLVRALSLALQPGMHIMITGSNGVGKTAVARVLAGLWSPSGVGARITRPASETDTPNGRPRPGVFIIPQRAYMVSGSLLEQVIYPQTLGEFYALQGGNTEEGLKELQGILESAHLGYLVEREGGWGTVKEWRDVLSGGEKQRMALSRVFYHRPKFAILDECTSAVSSDVEGQMYEHAKSLGISLITISLRPSLAKYHTHLLTLVGDGTGRWTFTPIANTDTATPSQPDGSTCPTTGPAASDLIRVLEEIRMLEKQLEEAKVWEARVRELEEALQVRKEGEEIGVQGR